MTESTTDMDRAMQGIDDADNHKTIPWTKCSERMPPDDDIEILIRKVDCVDFIQTPANEIWYDINPEDVNGWEWTPYTPEAWKEVNKWQSE